LVEKTKKGLRTLIEALVRKNMSKANTEWGLAYYQETRGTQPVFEFIEGLNLKAQMRVVEGLRVLREFGVNLGNSHIKKLTGTELWEFRILGSNNLRIIFVPIANRRLLLLHAFLKKKQKTDKHEMKTAVNRFKSWGG